MSNIRAAPIDYWAVALVTRGQQRTRWGDTVVESRPGNLRVYSPVQPYEEERTGIDITYVFVPRDALPGASDTLDALCGRSLDGAAAVLFAEFVASTSRALPAMGPDQVASLARAMRAMLGILAVFPAWQQETGGRTLQLKLLAHCEQLIAEHLTSAALGVAKLARLSGASRSSLYRLFEPHGGVASYIQGERLRRAAAALGDPADLRKVSQIAASCGLFDHSAFSRMFRARFGATPSDFRRAAIADLPLLGDTKTSSVPVEGLASFLRSLKSQV
jgi:AraC-like DNA-binding protein